MAGVNRAKAERVYRCIDESGGFYRGTAEPASRSQMNVTFRLAGEDLEKRFLDEATKIGLGGLKGHRSVGGCRASLYNAVSMQAVEALVEFMNTFAKRNG
jgi:phosphoserine aminotransferase